MTSDDGGTQRAAHGEYRSGNGGLACDFGDELSYPWRLAIEGGTVKPLGMTLSVGGQ
jgi:hypothetical protein